METAIVVSSCDAFKDCWQPMILSFKKYWPDCPFPIFFVSNFEELSDNSVTFLKVGEDKAFASNLKKALGMIDFEYIIYLQEDYFICENVDTKAIQEHIIHCKKESIDLLKIDNYTILRDNKQINNTVYCENPISEKYSIDTSASIWKKSVLEKVCIEGFSGWDFERKIIAYLKKNKIKIISEILHSDFYPQKGIKYVNFTAVCRGRWTKEGHNFLQKNGFHEIIPSRVIEGKLLTFFSSIYTPQSFFRIPIALIIKILQRINI